MIDATHSFRFFDRGPSPLVRLTFFAVLSVLLMFIDVRYRYLESTRSALSVMVSPVQAVATLPARLWNQGGDYFSLQATLKNQNQTLQQQHLADAAQLLKLQALQAESEQLRKLNALPLRALQTSQLAEVIYSERDLFKRKIIISKGARDQIAAGQVVIDDSGVVGQITRVFPFLSEVTLITEKDHVVPVQVLRNGLRTIVFGAGDTSQLSVRFMPISADVQNDDVLVTSGIDGTYPVGIPVAKIVKIERDAAYPFARITCLPLAGVDKNHQLIVLSSLAKLPDLPAAELDELGKKSKSKHGHP
jgi:rod shape-determining protein MreC